MKRRCHLILVDFWLYSSPQIRILAEKMNWTRIGIGSEIRKLLRGNTELGSEVKRYIEVGDIIPFSLLEPFWQKVLKETKSNNIYFSFGVYELSIWNTLSKMIYQNGFEIKDGWHIVKSNSDFSQEEKEAMRNWYKMGEDRHYDDVVKERKKANESIKKRTSSFINWQIVEINTTQPKR